MSYKKSIILDYRVDRRTLEIPNYRREDLGTVVRYTPKQRGADGIVCFTRVPANELGKEIDRHTSHFDSMSIGFEWKVYGSDEPEGLRKSLIEAGFEEGEPETLMAYPVTRFRPAERAMADGIEVRRVEDPRVLKQIAELQERIWGRSFPWLLGYLQSIWEHGAFYAAYDRLRLVGAGWISYPEGSRFAELHGGAVLADFRGRRIYSRIFERRMMDAVERGVPLVAVDAGAMSRPILESKGFEALDSTRPMLWSRS